MQPTWPVVVPILNYLKKSLTPELAIIGSERHDSRRVDRQLRGRAGRQGEMLDLLNSLFLWRTDLMRLFGSERISKVMDRFGYEEGEVIQHSMITKSIERAQRKVEKTILERENA